jgi:hypothetical protein
LRGISHAPPSPGNMPSFRNGTPKLAVSDAMRMSASPAMSQPSPMAGPFTAATNGISSPYSDRTIRCTTRR